MTFKHLIWGVALLGASILVHAQPESSQRRGPRANPEAQKEIKAYIESEVMPILKPEREKLDSYIGETEKNTLAEIRSDMKEMRKEGRELRQSFMEARKSGEMPSEEAITKMREMGKQQRLLMNQAWEIADEYEIEIYEIFDGLRPQAESWKTDMKAIMDKYKPTDAPQSSPQQAKGERSKGSRPPGRGGMGRRGGNPVGRLLESPVMFLLWDGSTNMEQVGSTDGPRAFPNPSTGDQKLTYKVKKAGKVNIELLDPSGVVVRSLDNETKEIGEYTLDVDTKGLKPGVYMYKITTATGTKTKKIKVE